MEVYLKKDVPNVGRAGQIIKVQPGFGNNFLIPRGLAVPITQANRDSFKKIEAKPKDPEVAHTETSLLADKIGATRLVIRRKIHEGKLYAAIRQAEIVELLAEKGFRVNKNQIIFERPIKEKGAFKVIIKLSTKLQPTVHIDVIAE